MSKIAGIKDKSLETYGERSGQPTISTESLTYPTPIPLSTVLTNPTSLLPAGPIEAGGSGDRIIVMFSGVLQRAAGESGPATAVAKIGIYLDGSSTPSYFISVFVPATNAPPTTPPLPTPFSLFWETPANGAYEVDVKAVTTSGACYAANGSIVLITTPV